MLRLQKIDILDFGNTIYLKTKIKIRGDKLSSNNFEINIKISVNFRGDCKIDF